MVPSAAHAPLDLVRTHAEEYRASGTPFFLRVPRATYLALTGTGRPGGPDFQGQIRALYATAYSLKFLEKERGKDFRVPMLEGIYEGLRSRRPSAGRPMRWRLLVRVPDQVGSRDLSLARARLKARARDEGTGRVRLWKSREGPCVQVLHVGPYASEEATVARMEAFARSSDRSLVGPHHEIYLSDPSRTRPGALRTVLRIPVGPPPHRPVRRPSRTPHRP